MVLEEGRLQPVDRDRLMTIHFDSVVFGSAFDDWVMAIVRRLQRPFDCVVSDEYVL